MTVHHVASVRGQECIILQNAVGVLPEEGVDSSGRTIVHIDFPISNASEWMESHYWDGSSWQERGPKPNDYAQWSEEEVNWVWNFDDILADVRLVRNQKLRLSDWTRLDDTGLSEESKSAWAVYRQSLRDITENLEGIQSVDDVVWPETP
jgi:hypothetical protein